MSKSVPEAIEQWGVFEHTLTGPLEGNPFIDVTLRASFTNGSASFETDGFYDGEGTYRVRFMPDRVGTWTYRTSSNCPQLDGQTGEFQCRPPSPLNHGPVRVRNTFHFGYTDGTPYFPFGTTCYAWTHQDQALQEQTLATLKRAPFNKVRMCVFPKDYIYNDNEPPHYPFVRTPEGAHDFTRFNPEFFRHFERCVAQLCDLGIQADLILFHPYDRWGYCEMDAESDSRYVRYLVARLSAYRNVWWSMANEYDFMLDLKPMEQWDHYFAIIASQDPYGHLCSIHNGSTTRNYDHTKPWITHVSIQNWDVNRVKEWRTAYQKPIVNDECEYEGNIPRLWGNLSAQELVHRFWVMVTNGGYAGHGETFLHPQDILWWSKGGVLYGESWKRIGFLREIIEQDVVEGLTPLQDGSTWARIAGGHEEDYRLIYFGEHQPAHWSIGFPAEDADYAVDIIDTWEMTITHAPLAEVPFSPPVRGVVSPPQSAFGVKLPGKPGLAVRVRRVDP